MLDLRFPISEYELMRLLIERPALSVAGVLVLAVLVWTTRKIVREYRIRRFKKNILAYERGRRRRYLPTLRIPRNLRGLVIPISVGGVALIGLILLQVLSPDLVSEGGGRDLNGRVSHVRDGDTIEVNGTAIRFARLDCDERGTPNGDRATREMRRLVSGKRVECRLTGARSYDRFIGSCSLEDGRDLGREMRRGGFCRRWW